MEIPAYKNVNIVAYIMSRVHYDVVGKPTNSYSIIPALYVVRIADKWWFCGTVPYRDAQIDVA